MSTTTEKITATDIDEIEGAFVRPDHIPAIEAGRPDADVVVKGRNVEIPDHFRIHVGGKLTRLEKFDPTIGHFDVELTHERNRRQAKRCQRLEITVRRTGPVVRAEATADSFYAALEAAVAKVESRLRRTKDRRRVHHGLRTPVSVAEATAPSALPDAPRDEHAADRWDDVEEKLPGQVVRVKEHPAIPMSVDDALYEMELVGHDFFLFQDKETDRPTVVYRRHAFDYGVIRLA